MARILAGTECTPNRRPVAAASWRVASGPAWRRVGGQYGKGRDDSLPRSGTPRAGVDSWRSLTPDSAGGTLRVGGEDPERCLFWARGAHFEAPTPRVSVGQRPFSGTFYSSSQGLLADGRQQVSRSWSH